MKKKIILMASVLLLSTICLEAVAQKKNDYVPEKGFWQLISNKHDKKTVTVQFYNEDKVLMYEETLHARLNVNRKKTRRELCEALSEAYKSWSFNHARPEATNLIAKRM